MKFVDEITMNSSGIICAVNECHGDSIWLLETRCDDVVMKPFACRLSTVDDSMNECVFVRPAFRARRTHTMPGQIRQLKLETV